MSLFAKSHFRYNTPKSGVLMFSVRFWGVRGSMPCPGPETVAYGGNTSCLEIRAGKRLLIVDLGTGIRPLGDRLMSKDYWDGPVEADIFVTHTHWDHIMGFPMFTPIFSKDTKLFVRGPVSSDEDDLGSIIDAHFSHRYWPVKQSELAATIEFDEIKAGEIDLGDGILIKSEYLNHPLPCLGFRFEFEGKSVVTIFDHEPYPDEKENEKVLKFIENADVLIHDSQYTAEEFKNRAGWGHSSFEWVFESAVKAKIKNLIFFHHDPNRSDRQLKKLEKQFRCRAAKTKTGIKTAVAWEGLVLDI